MSSVARAGERHGGIMIGYIYFEPPFELLVNPGHYIFKNLSMGACVFDFALIDILVYHLVHENAVEKNGIEILGIIVNDNTVCHDVPSVFQQAFSGKHSVITFTFGTDLNNNIFKEGWIPYARLPYFVFPELMPRLKIIKS